MIERMTHPDAGNWVDRGQHPEVQLRRVLAFHLGRSSRLPADRLEEHVLALRGMIDADASEEELDEVLRIVETESGCDPITAEARQVTTVALWHVGKCAEVRDRAQRLMRHGERPPHLPMPQDASVGNV